MNSISNSHYNNLKFRINKRRLFDFQLSDTEIKTEDLNNQLLYSLQFDTNKLSGDVDWDGKTVNISSINNFGLTGLDNGRIPYDPVLGYESTVNFQPELTEQLELHSVSGYTQNIDYLIIQADGQPVLLGGFFQGFYKLEGYDYQLLPERMEEGWTLSVDLNKGNYNTIGLNTLNDYASNNGYDTSGFFYYTGTRAENKYWNQMDTESIEGMTEATYDGVVDGEFIIPLPPPRVVIKEMDNQFLIYGRSGGDKICTNNPTYGFGTHMAQNDLSDPNIERTDDGTTLRYSGHATFNTFEEINPFLKYGRSSGNPISGNPGDDADVPYEYGTATADNDPSKLNLETELNPNLDLVDNAIGFRVKDDGSIGYRRIIGKETCEEAPTNIIEETDDLYVIEDYTEPGLIGADWANVTLRWVTDIELDCDTSPVREGTLDVFVNGFLVHRFEKFLEVINKPLDEYKDKQLGVPYNISIGGGTQGLFENMTFGGSDPSDLGLLLERNFGGTFIGGLKNFKLFKNPLSFCNVKNNVNNNQ